MPETIPGLLAAAADRDPDGVWLRTDEEQLTFAEAAARVAAAADRLRAAGVGSGDRVLVTARQFEDIGVTREELAQIQPVTQVPRPLTAAELLDWDGDL